MIKRIFIITILSISIALGLTVVINDASFIEKVNALTCTCCSDPVPGNNCPNSNSHNGDTCSWPWDMCGDKKRCSSGTTVRSCDGSGGGGCDSNKWGRWSSCSASCPAGFGGIRKGTQKRKNDCGKSQSRSCSKCCAQNVVPATLSSPPDGSEVNSITPTLSWNPTTNWGFRCPNSQIRDYKLLLSPALPNGSCNVSSWVYQVTVNENTTSAVIPRSAGLVWGTKYCWRVQTINNNTANSPIWSFTANIDSFFQTYGGDVYIGSGVPETIKSAPRNFDLSTQASTNLLRILPGSRIEAFQNDVANKNPFVSSQLFVSPSLVVSNRASSKGEVVDFDDTESVDQYSDIFVSDDFSDQRSYTENFYGYYRNYFTQKAVTNADIISGQLNSNVLSGSTVREAFGISSTEEKRIVILSNSTTDHNFELKGNPTTNSQSGFNYDENKVFDRAGFDDWSGVTNRREKIICDKQTIFIIPGNLKISADVVNANKDSSCIFIVEGHTSFTLPDILGYTPSTPNLVDATVTRIQKVNSKAGCEFVKPISQWIVETPTGFNISLCPQAYSITIGQTSPYIVGGIVGTTGSYRTIVLEDQDPSAGNKLPDYIVYFTTQPGKGTTSPYRIVEALILSNSVSFSGKDEHGPVVVNGSVITNNTAQTDLQPTHFDPFRSNKFDIKTYRLERPQVFMTYDPRHITIWAKELKGEAGSSTIRETRFLRLIKEVDGIR